MGDALHMGWILFGTLPFVQEHFSLVVVGDHCDFGFTGGIRSGKGKNPGTEGKAEASGNNSLIPADFLYMPAATTNAMAIVWVWLRLMTKSVKPSCSASRAAAP